MVAPNGTVGEPAWRAQHRKVMASWRGNVTDEAMTQDVRDLMLAVFEEMCQLVGQHFLADGGPTRMGGHAIEDFRRHLREA